MPGYQQKAQVASYISGGIEINYLDVVIIDERKYDKFLGTLE